MTNSQKNPKQATAVQKEPTDLREALQGLSAEHVKDSTESDTLSVTPTEPVVEPAADKPPVVISEAFESASAKLDQPEVDTEAEQASNHSVLDAMTFSVDSIEIVESDSITISTNTDTMLEERGTFSVVCLHSAYEAKMTSIRFDDKMKLLNTDDNPHDYRRKLYKVVYDHISEMSIPKPTFDSWLKVTAYADMETLLYGIFSRTYPGKSDFDITCGKCENDVKINIDSDRLIIVRDESAYKQVIDVINSTSSLETLLQKTTLNKTFRKLLGGTKLLVDLKNPSLSDHLAILKSFSPSELRASPVIIGTLIYLSDIYIPDITKIKELHRPVYNKLTDTGMRLNIIGKLPDSDVSMLEEGVTDISKKYSVEYKIPALSCMHCGNHIDEIPLDLEKLLFLKISGKF